MTKKRPFLWVLRTLVLAVTLGAGLLFVQPSHVSADYACGTYGAGNFGSDNYDNTSCSTGTSGTRTVTTGDTAPTDATTPEDVTQSTDIYLNDYSEYVSGQGKSLVLSLNQVVHFTVNGQPHTATVKTITADYVVLTIASTPHDVTTQKGQTVQDDVDGDGVKDIGITFTGSNGNVATIVFQEITTKTETVATTTPKTSGFPLWFWLVGAAALIVIIIVVLIVRRAIKQDNVIQD